MLLVYSVLSVVCGVCESVVVLIFNEICENMFYNMFFLFWYIKKMLLFCGVKIMMKIAQSFYLKKTNTKKTSKEGTLRKVSFLFAYIINFCYFCRNI